MSKFGLGRGLGDLMNGDKVAGQTGTPPAENGDKVTPGVGSLLQARKTEQENVFADPKTGEHVPIPQPAFPAWYLFAADLLLIVFTVVLLWRSNFGGKEMILGFVALSVGAALSILAVLQR